MWLYLNNYSHSSGVKPIGRSKDGHISRRLVVARTPQPSFTILKYDRGVHQRHRGHSEDDEQDVGGEVETNFNILNTE